MPSEVEVAAMRSSRSRVIVHLMCVCVCVCVCVLLRVEGLRVAGCGKRIEGRRLRVEGYGTVTYRPIANPKP